MVKDLKNRMTIRFDDKSWSFISDMSERTGLTPSDYIRMMVNTAMYSFNQANEITKNAIENQVAKFSEGVDTHDDDKTHNNGIV